jgi:hypothetical protein
LFVLVLPFMNFSSGVSLAVGFKPETGEVISADVPLPTLCRNALADSGGPQSLRGLIVKPAFQDSSIRTLTYMRQTSEP